MRIIRPGKPGGEGETPRGETAKPGRKVWDDYGERKGRRKAYERVDSARTMLRPARQPLRFAGEAEAPPMAEAEEPVPVAVDYTPLEKKLGYTFRNPELLTRALTHRSALSFKDRADYERLEFLGDAVLDLSVAHLLCERYPEAKEGELSKMRAALVNTQALAGIARELELGPFIRLGRGEMSSGGNERPSILADVTEAIFGAMYQESSYAEAFECVSRIFGAALEQVEPSDPKTELQELLHVAGSEPPAYLLEMVEGPEHAPTFVTVVVIDGEVAGRGRGTTKKGAQQAAAAESLLKLQWGHEPIVPSAGHDFFIERGMLVRLSPVGESSEVQSVPNGGESTP